MAIIFRKGSLSDADAFVQFLAEVRADMVQKDWLYLDPPEMIREMMAGGILELWVAMDGDRVAAAFSILHPGLESFNYGYELGLTKEELLSVVHMDTSAVHPAYRGQGLQRKMVQTAEEALSGRGEKILLCTVHPENQYSLRNMQTQGYSIRKRVEMYGSERYILQKNIFLKK